MSEDISQALGRIEGKLDTVHDEFKRSQLTNETSHQKIFDKLQDHGTDIDQAKGAKTMILLFAGGVSAAVSFLSKKLW